jgi:hypothetical protein
MLQSPSSSLESRASWIVASGALVTIMMAFGSAWITVVALKDIAAEVGGTRSIPALASALAWLCSGAGGILMGLIAGLIGTIRRECLDHLTVFGETHLRRILGEYAAFYNGVRTHRAVQSIGAITSRPVLGGLHHQYCRI